MPPRKGSAQAQLASDGTDETCAHGLDDAGEMEGTSADSPTARPRRKAAQTSKAAAAADSDDEFEPAPAPPKKKQKGKRKANADTEDEYAGESEEFEPPAKTVKRSTAGKKGKSRRPKKLELFQTMPLDVLALIVGELDTKTVLAMSRTCSLFRRLLHSPQGTSVWKAARFNTSNIPDLTAGDLEEWMYASLLFDSTCQVCHKPRANVTDWTLRVRACAKCMKANSKQRLKMYGMHNAHRLVWECVPESKWSPGYFDEGAIYSFFWLPTVQAVSAHLKELDGKPGFDDYVKERKRIKQAATVDGAAIGRWWATWQASKSMDAWDAKFSRQEKINAKLIEMGYTKRELDSSSIQNHSLMKQARDLTDRIWKTVSPKFVEILEKEREDRRARELAAAMKKRADALKPFYDSLQSSIASAESRALFPPFGNFLMFDSVKTLYEPEDADQSPTALAAARNSIMDDANRFAAEIKSAFYSQLVKAHNDAGTELQRDQAGATMLSQTAVEQLAKKVESAVKCPSVWCTTYMTFPAVLDHYKVCGSQPLTAESLSTSAARILATKHVIAVVNAVEPDRFKDDPPSTTTLYALGTAFKCDDCKSREGAVGPAIWSGRYQGSARWSGMVQHILDKHAQPTFVLPVVEYTPPAPPSPGQDNPGGFVVEDDG